MAVLLSALPFLLALASAESSPTVEIESFDKPVLTWKQKNDPVMGGKSTGTFTFTSTTGVFDGHVVDVPFLKAPGFIKATGTGDFPDVSTCSSLVITARAAQNFTGFRVSFGTAKPPGGKFFAYGYKAHFDAPVGDAMSAVEIPFNKFSDYWDDATGQLIKTCADSSKYCPDQTTLKNMKTLSIWAEGVAGEVHLEISAIGASGCTGPLVEPLGEEVAASFNSSCSGTIQPSLRYNISKTAAAQDWALPVPPGETLASAVCCDVTYKPFAEPQHLFARPDVQLFKRLNANGTTTFYDSVCGLPLFEAPRGRTMAEFQADTTEHGWPSFRSEELVSGNSHVVNGTGEVLSKCGTHLGSYLPDDKGPRWCLDLSCIAGNPK